MFHTGVLCNSITNLIIFMKKKVSILIIIVIVLLLTIGAYYYFKSTPDNGNKIVEESQSSFVNSFQNTNPFDVDVNPYQGYKNPFE